MVAQTYLEFPEIILLENWKPKTDELSVSEEEITCILDSVAHSLITSIAKVQPGKDWAKGASHEYDICLRKIASTHPTLVLRYCRANQHKIMHRIYFFFVPYKMCLCFYCIDNCH